MKITSRISSITNAFVSAIVPVFMPTEKEVAGAISSLGMSPEDLRCVYCGDPSTEWDHLRPLVKGKRPTGYVSEIANLVPACGKCNQSKGANDWRGWMRGNARLCPTRRSILDIEDRIAKLEAFERWREPRKVDLELAAGPELWHKHWSNREALWEMMQVCQKTADQIRTSVQRAVSAKLPENE
jgi:hypothetical protein